ncbi:MAG TPA: glycosyltransferase [Verrucomicrobiae bacterium]|nr:glycosyltransferase [Verrucomicrobiae bacterium]
MNTESGKRIYFFANGIYSDQISGGDIHFFHMAQTAMDAGYIVHFFGGHALEKQLRSRFKHFELTLTDRSQAKPFNANSFFGQFKLLADYARRLFGSLRRISKVQPDEIAYAVNDYWFDVWPMLCCKARRKLMILGMDAPTLREILFRARPDVTASRLNSIYYWLSQNLSLWLFHFRENKRLFYVHPDMESRLLRIGYEKEEMVFISNGMNLKAVEQVPSQKKEFDVIWLGRVHRQKGIDDLLATLVVLSKKVKDFRAVLVGRLQELEPRLKELNLTDFVKLSGLVSEEEKFRLFKASRVFLMPSRQESWGIVIAESLACGTPTVAYDLPAYRPIFGALVDYVPCFDFELFKKKSLEAVEKSRRGQIILDAAKSAELKSEHSWEAAGNRFIAAAKSL